MKNDLIINNLWSNRHFPSIFNPNIIEEIFSSMDSKIFNVNSSYPYDIIVVKDNDGETKEIRIIYALAGFDSSEVSAKVIGNELKIYAEKKEEKESNENITFLHQGIARRTLKVTFSIGPDIDKSKITSKFNNGMFYIFLPVKKEETIDIPITVE